MIKPLQSGQALVEMTLGMFMITLVMIAMIYVAGYGISNVEYLINARHSAEQNADNGSGGAGQNIQNWTYTDVSMDGSEDYHMPFYYRDKANVVGDMASSTFLSSDDGLGKLSGTSYSTVLKNNNFYPTLAINDIFLNAANLAEGKGDLESDPVYTLDESKMSSEVKNEINRETLDSVMFSFFGIGPKNSIAPVDIPANKVYIPVTTH